MVNTIKNSIILLLFLVSVIACEKDDVAVAQVDAMVSETAGLVNKSFPLGKVRVEGQGLTGLKQIILDNKINVSFNPTYNSDRAFIFTVPFDETNGSRFGLQPITFITDGGTVSKQFEILQPEPTISKFTPEVPKVNTTCKVEGDWFYNIISVTLRGNSITYIRLSPTTIDITIPNDPTLGSEELVITTASGSVAKPIVISQGFVFTTISDFDGNGSRLNWGSAYGDMATWTQTATAGGINGQYAQITWVGATGNGYNGYSGGGGPAFLPAAITNANDVFLEFDYYTATVGTNIAIQFNTIVGVNWGRNFKSTTTGWQKASVKLLDFVNNYGFGTAVPGNNVDPSKVEEIKFGFAQGDTPNPSVLRLDNIKIKYVSN